MRKALITGCAGQDGSYLAEILLAEGTQVFGLARESTPLSKIPAGVIVLHGDLQNARSLQAAVAACKPDEIYNLAGVTDLQTAYADPEATWRINYEAVGTLLHAGLEQNPKVRFLQASSSEVFLPSDTLLNEDSPRDITTSNPYSRAKIAADEQLIRVARAQGSFACSAILFNHESPRRSERSVLRKISRGLVQVHLGMAPSLNLGNLDLSRDWSFAGDLAQAMKSMLMQESPTDLVLATGTMHTVREAVMCAANFLGMGLRWIGSEMESVALNRDGQKIVGVCQGLFRPAETRPKAADVTKFFKTLPMLPTVDFRRLVEMLVLHDLESLRSSQQTGEMGLRAT
jgi:GDPmannose 4,6-dehydratase